MKLMCRTNGLCYGIVGAPTKLVDYNGSPLFIGDIVLLTHVGSGISMLRFVANSNGEDYVMGASIYMNGINSENAVFRIKKIAGYESLGNKFQLGDMKYAVAE